MSDSLFQLFAPAKINLSLQVTGRRADGYHLLQSLVAFVDVGDVLEFFPQENFSLEIKGPFAPELTDAKDNLIYKAAQLLAEHYSVPPRGKIALTKNLPVASGIGGGSSDAAAALKGLAKLWRLSEDFTVLAQIGQRLGADVPVCLQGKPAWVEGIGEQITLLSNSPDLHFVLANPLQPTPTTEVFRRFRGPFSPPVQFSGDWLSGCNDLTAAAIAVTPEIKKVLSALADTECRVCRLSGSGATCFAVYESASVANAAAQKLKAQYPQWWVTKAALLPA